MDIPSGKKRPATSAARDVMRVFWHASRPHWGKIVVILTAGGVAELAHSVVAPIFYKRFIDVLTQARGEDTAQTAALLAWALAAIVAVRFGGSICATIKFHFSSVFQVRVMSSLRTSAYERILGQSYQFFADAFTGSLVNRISNLVNAFQNFTDTVMTDIWTILLATLGSLAVFFYYDTTIGALVLAWVVAITAWNIAFSKWRQKYDYERAAKGSVATGVLSDGLSNALNVKMFTATKGELSRFGKVEDEFRVLQLFTWQTTRKADLIRGWLTIALEFAVMTLAIRGWARGEMTVGTIVLFQSYIIGLHGRMANIGRIVRSIYISIADAKEAVDILNLPNDVKDKRGAKALAVKRGAVDLRQVTFNYHQDRPILDGLDLRIKAGERVALVGASGAGKSTVIKLLLRFYDTDKGNIFIDGQDISKVTQDSLRRAIALVPQEPLLFHRSLKENIAYAKPEASDEEIIRASKQAHCHEFISALPKGYDTLVGERGVKLSGGERQRVAIARAIVKDAPILLLDEATSSLDSESEALIQDALRGLMRGKTVVVIAHRLSTIMQMDRIVVMEEGKVVDTGTHAELLAKVGTYKKLWNIQVGGFRTKAK